MTARARHAVASVVAGLLGTLVSFPFLVPSGCNDVDGVPSWERCISFVGTPAFSVEDFGWDNTLDVLQPLLAGLLVALVTWWILSVVRQEPDDDV